jgi:hypothetical protein
MTDGAYRDGLAIIRERLAERRGQVDALRGFTQHEGAKPVHEGDGADLGRRESSALGPGPETT